MANLANQIEELKQTQRKLIDNFKINTSEKDLTTVREISTQIESLKRLKTLEDVNGKQSRLRETAKLAWECEQPETDITTNSGEFHAVKVKKYPKLAALQYTRAKFEDNKLTELSINGQKFRMFNVKYEYNKPNEYTRPKTFNDFLALNWIMAEDLTIEKYEEVIKANNEINEEIEQAIKTLDTKIQALKMHSLNHWGLFKSSQNHFTEYYAN